MIIIRKKRKILYFFSRNLIFLIKLNRIYSKTVAMSVLLYCCTNCTFTKFQEKELHGNNTRMLCYFEQIMEAALHKKTSCMATYLPSHKQSKQNMLSTAGGITMNLSIILLSTPPHGQTSKIFNTFAL